MNFFYDEGPAGDFRPVLRDFTIENVNVIGGAPYSMFIRGYPDHPTTSFIGVTLRNISFSGLTNDPHYVLQDVDFVSATDITVDGELWDVLQSSSTKVSRYEMLVFVGAFIQIAVFCI